MATENDLDDAASISSMTSMFDGVNNDTTNAFRTATNEVRSKFENWKIQWSTYKGPWEQARIATGGNDDDDIDAELQNKVAEIDADRAAILEHTEKLVNGLLTESNKEANVRQITRNNYNAFNKFRRTMKRKMATKYGILDTEAGQTDDSLQRTIHDNAPSTDTAGPTVPAITIAGISSDNPHTVHKTPRGRATSPFFDKARIERQRNAASDASHDVTAIDDADVTPTANFIANTDTIIASSLLQLHAMNKAVEAMTTPQNTGAPPKPDDAEKNDAGTTGMPGTTNPPTTTNSSS